MRAVIFANGMVAHPENIPALLRPGDLLIAADGGSRHARRLGLALHAVIGDFDSLTPTELGALRSAGAKIVEFPARKDYTDLELALQYAEEHGVTEALIIGGLGERWDQTLANLLLPTSYPGLHVRLVDGAQELFLLHSKEKIELHGRPGDTVSLIPIGGDAEGVQTHGLEYSLHDEALKFGGTRGVSNILAGHTATISLQRGLLVIVHIRSNRPLE